MTNTKLYPTCEYGEIGPIPYTSPPICAVSCRNPYMPDPYCYRTFMTDGKIKDEDCRGFTSHNEPTE